MEIVVTKDSYIQSFNYYFLTPIQQHLNRINMVVTPDRVDYVEETYPISLDELHCAGITVRKLISCEHEFHEQCLQKVLHVNLRYPL